jgi:hypothetical protein
MVHSSTILLNNNYLLSILFWLSHQPNQDPSSEIMLSTGVAYNELNKASLFQYSQLNLTRTSDEE